MNLKSGLKMKSEGKVQKEIMEWIVSQGHMVHKIMKANENGYPDLIICWDGVYVTCEVKREEFYKNPEKQMSAWQHKQKNKIERHNGKFVCAATLEQFKDFANATLS